MWAYDAERVWTVLREDVTLDVDPSRYFESDRIGVRATMRAAFGFTHAASVVKITAA